VEAEFSRERLLAALGERDAQLATRDSRLATRDEMIAELTGASARLAERVVELERRLARDSAASSGRLRRTARTPSRGAGRVGEGRAEGRASSPGSLQTEIRQ